MLGGIYSDQKCSECGSKYVDDGRKGLFCPNHPGKWATRFRVKFQGVYKRFDSYKEAQRFLTGLRFQHDQGVFDVRDWKRDHPLGFATLVTKWLEVKKGEIKPHTWGVYTYWMGLAIAAWGQTNIKEIGYAEIEDFLLARKVSGKTRANMRSCLHTFWTWLRKRRILALHQMPEFPEVRYELGFRKIVDKPTQQAIIEEVKRSSFHINPKVWLGIKWLSTYISIRPAELVAIKEEHINLEQGFLFIPHPKERRPKLVPLRAEDVDLIKALPRGLPHLPFFRHTTSHGGIKPGTKFGPKYLYKWWKRACANLGIEGVDLYGGTRHSSVRALGKYRTPEEIRRATMHSTNKAFERYYQMEADDLRAIYNDTQMAPVEGDKNWKV